MLVQTKRIGLLCLLCAIPLLEANAGELRKTGSMELYCGPPLALDIQLADVTANETLFLRTLESALRHTWRDKEPFPIGGRLCTPSNRCQQVSGAMVFKTLDIERSASGSYKFKSADGRVLEGAFKLVRKKPPKPSLCM